MNRYSRIPALMLLVLALSLSAGATTHTVTVRNFSFTPQTITIAQGDTVVWDNVQGFHNVQDLDVPPLFGNSSASAPWTYTFVFNVPARAYNYQCVVHGFTGSVIVQGPSDVPQRPSTSAGQFGLMQNYPNPFNPSTTIAFTVPYDAKVRLYVMNILGQEVRQMYSGEMSAGEHLVSFDASGMPTGLYFVRLDTPAGVFTRKMTYLK